jgi:hypothetical protein
MLLTLKYREYKAIHAILPKKGKNSSNLSNI